MTDVTWTAGGVMLYGGARRPPDDPDLERHEMNYKTKLWATTIALVGAVILAAVIVITIVDAAKSPPARPAPAAATWKPIKPYWVPAKDGSWTDVYGCDSSGCFEIRSYSVSTGRG